MTDHYYSPKPTAKSAPKLIRAHLRGKDFEFHTDSSVFSNTKIDNGTALLIEEATFDPGNRLLDLGCGYGALGIALKQTCRQCDLTLSDINQRATALAKKNAKQAGIVVRIVTADQYAGVNGEQFDAIFLNPPQTAGRKLCNAMVEQAPNYLKTGGFFWLVARHNVGGSEFEKKMNEVFGNVETIARQSGFRVYRSTKN